VQRAEDLPARNSTEEDDDTLIGLEEVADLGFDLPVKNMLSPR